MGQNQSRTGLYGCGLVLIQDWSGLRTGLQSSSSPVLNQSQSQSSMLRSVQSQSQSSVLPKKAKRPDRTGPCNPSEIGDEMTAQVARDELLSVFVSVLTRLTVSKIYLD